MWTRQHFPAGDCPAPSPHHRTLHPILVQVHVVQYQVKAGLMAYCNLQHHGAWRRLVHPGHAAFASVDTTTLMWPNDPEAPQACGHWWSWESPMHWVHREIERELPGVCRSTNADWLHVNSVAYHQELDQIMISSRTRPPTQETCWTDLNLRPSGYEPDELPTAPPRDEVPLPSMCLSHDFRQRTANVHKVFHLQAPHEIVWRYVDGGTVSATHIVRFPGGAYPVPLGLENVRRV